MKKRKETRSSRQASNGPRQKDTLLKSHFTPKLPTKSTYRHKVLKMLLQGEKITSVDFHHKTFSQRLPKYIHDLGKLGWIISRRDVPIAFKVKPFKRTLRQYYLDDEVIRKFRNAFGGEDE